MMDEDRGEDPAMSYQPMPALSEVKGSQSGEPPHSYSEGQPPTSPQSTDGHGGGGGGSSSGVGPTLPNIGLETIASPVFILALMGWHFFWVSWTNLGTVVGDSLGIGWLPDGWFYYAYSLIAVGIWAAADERPLTALAMVIFFAIGIFSDYIFLGIYMPHAIKATGVTGVATIVKNIRRFSFAAVIIHHLSKYLTVMVAIFAFKVRGGQAMIKNSNYREIP